MVDKIETRRETSWNLASLQSQHISYHMRKATSLFLEGNYGSWFLRLVALSELIRHDLNDSEKKEIDELEKGINIKKWEQWKKLKDDGLEISEELSKDISRLGAKIKTFQRAVFNNLKKLGYFPQKTDRRFIEGIS